VAANIVETINNMQFEVVLHLVYSPNLVPSYFHLFGPLKEAYEVRNVLVMMKWKKQNKYSLRHN